jgi:RNA 3'-terminal phosphate cyclase (ATP)
LLLPLAVGAGGTFRTTEPSLHTRTNAQVIRHFVDADIELSPEGESWRVDVRPAR